MSVRVPCQVPPAAPNDQFEGHMEAMAHYPPVGGIAVPERLDPQHADIPNGMIDYHPQPLRVSNSHLLDIEPPFY